MRTAGGHVSLLWDLAHGRAPRGHRCLRQGESLLRLSSVPFIWQQCAMSHHVMFHGMSSKLSWWAGGSGWPRALLFTLCATYHPFRALLITPSSN